MSYDADVYRPQEYTLADRATTDERASFIVKTYMHLFGAIFAFALISAVLQILPFAKQMTDMMMATQYGWLVVLGLFMGVSWVANSWAHNTTSVGMQYMGLGLFIVAESIIFAPLLYWANQLGGESVIASAGVATGFVFTGLTAIVFFTRKNFSFMGPFLGLMGFVAMGLIVCSILFGLQLGVIFTVLMIGFAGAYILYTTSNILHEYRIGQHVAASLALFASVALLFYYILILFMSRR